MRRQDWIATALLLALVAGFVYYTYTVQRRCDGQLVRGVWGWECIER